MGYCAQKKYQRMQTSALKIQSVFRGFVQRNIYRKTVKCIQWIQHKKYMYQKDNQYGKFRKAAVQIQKFYKNNQLLLLAERVVPKVMLIKAFAIGRMNHKKLQRQKKAVIMI